MARKPVKKTRPTYQRPLIKTARIEVRCSDEEKDRIYAYAMMKGLPASELLLQTTLAKVDGQPGLFDE